MVKVELVSLDKADALVERILKVRNPELWTKGDIHLAAVTVAAGRAGWSVGRSRAE